MQSQAQRTIAAAISTTLGLFAHGPASAITLFTDGGLAPSAAGLPQTDDRNDVARYLVQFEELPVALYDGSLPGFAAIPRKQSHSTPVRSHLDLSSRQALAYASRLESLQEQKLAVIRLAIGRSIAPVHQLRHALNAIVFDLSSDEARRIRALPGVKAVTADRIERIATDISPAELGATSVWNGDFSAPQDRIFDDGFDGPASGRQGYRGEGVVVAVLDTGINAFSPSFASPDESGYAFVNPLGAGARLGLCQDPAATWCSDKLFGMFDVTGAGQGGLDLNGHGSHTASTAAGNTRSASYFDYHTTISGMAPHANVIGIQVCAADGSCQSSAIASGVDTALTTNVVDVMNLSLSGGLRPWNDPVEQALLSATNAGIFVATAAGNTSSLVPTADSGTVNHASPWTSAVAAMTHSGGDAPLHLAAEGAGAPAPIETRLGVFQILVAATPSTPLIVSPTYGSSGDGCTAFAADAFANSVALLKFSAQCATADMAANAVASGAKAVIVANNTDAPAASGATTLEPVFMILASDGDALVSYAQSSSSPPSTYRARANESQASPMSAPTSACAGRHHGI
jgi:hypothetical protein